jgi:hypothetical protein
MPTGARFGPCWSSAILTPFSRPIGRWWIPFSGGKDLWAFANKSELPDSWRLDFPDLEAYRNEWPRQARAVPTVEYTEPVRDALFRATNLRDIDLRGNTTVCHTKFDATIALAGGGIEVINW